MIGYFSDLLDHLNTMAPSIICKADNGLMPKIHPLFNTSQNARLGHYYLGHTYFLILIGQLHKSLKEFIKKLIALTSCLDAVVASINALNHCYVAFKLVSSIKYYYGIC